MPPNPTFSSDGEPPTATTAGRKSALPPSSVPNADKPHSVVLTPILPATGPGRLVRVAPWPLFRDAA